jgi:hypothetical protein
LVYIQEVIVKLFSAAAKNAGGFGSKKLRNASSVKTGVVDRV